MKKIDKDSKGQYIHPYGLNFLFKEGATYFTGFFNINRFGKLFIRLHNGKTKNITDSLEYRELSYEECSGEEAVKEIGKTLYL